MNRIGREEVQYREKGLKRYFVKRKEVNNWEFTAKE